MFGGTTCPSISILCPTVISVECLVFFCLSSFVLSSRLRRATRIYPTGTAWHSASGNASARQPAPLVPDSLVCKFCVGFWTTANLKTFSVRADTLKALSFLSACLSGGLFVREFGRCDPVGAV